MSDINRFNITNVTMMNTSLAARSLPEVSVSRFTRDQVMTQMQAILLANDNPLRANEVRRAWSCYLELVVEPAGWMAILIPSADTARMLKVDAGRRGAMVVEVLNINCDVLEAEVEILRSSDDRVISDGFKSEVPIDELYPLKNQEFDTLNMNATVVALDLIRFFYKHIWMPWDEDSDIPDWPGQHLANRINLHFSLATGKGNEATAIRLDELACKAEMNRTALQELEEAVGLADEDSLDVDPELSYQVVGKLYQLHQEQDSIRREAELLENPMLRIAVTANKVAARKEGRSNLEPGMLIVWGGGAVSEFNKLTESIGDEFGSESNILVFPDIQHAIDTAVVGDNVIVCSAGEHKLRGLGALSKGGKIIGRVPTGKVTLVPGDTSNVFLGLENGVLEFRDLNLDFGRQSVGMLVRGGDVIMENVSMTGGDTMIRITGKSKSRFLSCKNIDGGIAYDLGEACYVEIGNCIIERNRIGISTKEGAVMIISGCYINGNMDHGIVLICKEGGVEGFWERECAIQAAKERGIDLSRSEIGFNMMGDFAVLCDIGGLNSADVERQCYVNRRFSTPLAGVTHSQLISSSSMPNTPIQHTTTRVLNYFPGDHGSPL